MTAWTAGTQVGPYVLVSPLGTGGMGEVWKARDDRLNRPVAIKRLAQHDAARFAQEARAIAALNHPHICQIYDVGPDYLVMEHIEGAPVRGPLPTQEAVRLGVQIASALEEAHGQHILHRDLKPGNILVTPKGAAKLLDFGLARLMTDSDATRSMASSGTPLYMSPEQVENQPLDARSDIFSFGAVLYELLSGRRAFDTVAAVLRDMPAPLEGPVGGIALRCLAKQPAARFQSVAEIKAAFERVGTILTTEQSSIAVLPFANMSGDKEQEYFSDGLAEEIITALAQIPGLKVTARTSAFAFRGKEQDIRKIAEALDVRTILEGSVRRAGNQIRVTTQLIDAANGYHLWSQRYDRELEDVFAVQDEIAAAIADALKLKLTPPPGATERYKPNLPAYEAYLRARRQLTTMTPESFERAKEYYDQAIAFDPGFALAYSAFAGLLYMFSVAGFRPPRDVVPQLRALAQKALDLDPSLADAHAVLAMVSATFDYDWKEAERRFALVMARDPVSPWVRQVYARHLLMLGRPLEAIVQIGRAVEEDPLSVFYRYYLALTLWAAGRDAETVRELHHVIELDENFSATYTVLVLYHASRGELEEALRFADKASALEPHPHTTALLAGLLARAGDAGRAGELLATLEPPQTYGVPRALAFFHLLQGDIEKAADWWEKMIDQRDTTAAVWARLPVGKVLRASPRWPALARRMNLPE